MADIKFTDNSIQIKNALEDTAIAYLNEVSGELASQTARNSRVDTGQTKGSWNYIVDEERLESQVGSPLENAIWEELGTGEYALEGNGRKGGWYYEDKDKKGHFTHGKKPVRALFNAFQKLKSPIIKRGETIFKELNNK